jgi:hypothetical protein
MLNRVLNAAMLAAVALGAAACDGGSATAPGDARLTQAQALSLSRSIFAIGAGMSAGNVPSGARGARIQTAAGSNAFTFTLDTSVPCPAGGSTALAGTLAGSYDGVAKTGQVQANLAVTHESCAVKTDDGATFTLNGDPKIDVGLNAASGANGLTAFHLTEGGAFTWSRGDGSSGRCTVDLAGDLVSGTQNVRVTGTFCGFAVDDVVQGTH